MFSKACEYGIRAIIFIAHQSQQGNRVSLKDVAKAIDSPEAFTAKILQTLRKNELILSVKGAGGGYEFVNAKSSKITLYQVVVAIDGERMFTRCGLGLKKCSPVKPCSIHSQFKVIRDGLTQVLKTTFIRDLGKELDFGMAVLKL